MKKLFIIISLGISLIAKSQVDPHFSQYYMHPLWLNPALTGAINGDYRVCAINRNQWGSITNSFTTVGVTGDITTSKEINFGLNILQESAGDAGFKYQNAQGSISYSGIHFGKEGLKTISFGLQGGLINRHFDFSKLQGATQFKDYYGFDPSLSLNESFSNKSVTVFDMSAGLAYYDADQDKKVNIFGGLSAAHINQPKDPFFSTSTQSTIPMRMALHGGARIVVSDVASLVPNFVYVYQGNTYEFMAGGYAQYTLSDLIDVMAGVNYRYKDAFYPYLGLNFNSLIVGLSYDVNASNLGQAAKGVSSYEFSLMYTNRKGSDKGYFKCPRF